MLRKVFWLWYTTCYGSHPCQGSSGEFILDHVSVPPFPFPVFLGRGYLSEGGDRELGQFGCDGQQSRRLCATSLTNDAAGGGAAMHIRAWQSPEVDGRSKSYGDVTGLFCCARPRTGGCAKVRKGHWTCEVSWVTPLIAKMVWALAMHSGLGTVSAPLSSGMLGGGAGKRCCPIMSESEAIRRVGLSYLSAMNHLLARDLPLQRQKLSTKGRLGSR